MSFTAEYSAGQGAWIEVASGSEAVVQLQDPGPVDVVVASSTPATGESAPKGIVLDDQGLMEISLTGLAEADSVYVRSRHDEINRCVVIGSGSAPA